MLIKDQRAKLINTNSRSEGKEPNLVPAMDLTIQCIANCDVAGELLGFEGKPPLWHDNKDGDALFAGLSTIESWSIMKAEKVVFAGIVVKDCIVKDFSFTPVAGNKISLKLKVQFKQPNDKQLHLSNMIKHIGTLEIAEWEINPDKNPDLFDGSGSDKSEDDEK